MIRGKQVTLHFKRCGLKKYGKMIRGKQVKLHFKRCISDVAVCDLNRADILLARNIKLYSSF
jgi:hypothetical protein